MTIKQKIWSIPLITILIYSVWMAIAYNSASYIYASLQRIELIHYPYLRHIQTLSENLASIQGIFLDALDTKSKTTIIRASHKAEDFHNTIIVISKIDGKKAFSQEITAQFNNYYASAELAASILIGIEKGDSTASMAQMVAALNKLKTTLEQEHLTASQSFDESLDDSKSNMQKILWASLVSVVILLGGMIYTSHLLITSILSSLFYLRTGATKIAQGDFTTRIPELGKDELTQVIQCFNSMGEDLQFATEKRIQYEKQLETLNMELEERVTARTAELAVALEEANKANAAVAYMADHDTLTGLISRRRFQEEYERWGKYALRHERPVALLFIDLDRFKNINDTYGHLIGDEFLRAVSEALKKSLRSTDYIGRWGGDEFAVLLPESSYAAACEVAAKIIKILNSSSIAVTGHTLPASASIGIAVLPEHTSDTRELTAFADAAMYKAKNTGRNRFCLYSESEQEIEHLEEHARWAGRIRRALETDQFILFYQPLLNLKSGTATEYEALLRLEDRDGEFISPSLFLASAERFDLCISIDRMVLRKAAHKIAAFKAKDIKLRLSLNISNQFIEDAGMVDYFREVIREFDIDPGNLSIEISEEEILQNINRVRILSKELSELGSRLILDDIGVGFSSFHYLAPLSIHSIKIRSDLIHNLNIPENREYLRLLCKKCHENNIKVTAKFVENLSMLGTLLLLGVDYAQGFAVGKPLESLSTIDIA